MPEIINGKGEGIDIDGGKKFHDELKKHEIDFETHYKAEEGKEADEVKSGTRVTIELEGRFIRGRGSERRIESLLELAGLDEDDDYILKPMGTPVLRPVAS